MTGENERAHLHVGGPRRCGEVAPAGAGHHAHVRQGCRGGCCGGGALLTLQASPCSPPLILPHVSLTAAYTQAAKTDGGGHK